MPGTFSKNSDRDGLIGSDRPIFRVIEWQIWPLQFTYKGTLKGKYLSLNSNYIRQPPKKIEADPGAAGDDGDQQQQKRKQYDANIVLDPNKLGVVGKEVADKGTWTGTMLKRGVSGGGG